MEVSYGTIRVDGCEGEVACRKHVLEGLLEIKLLGRRTYFRGCVGKGVEGGGFAGGGFANEGDEGVAGHSGGNLPW